MTPTLPARRRESARSRFPRAAALLATLVAPFAGPTGAFAALPGPSVTASPNELAVGIRSGVDLGHVTREQRAARLADPTHRKPVYALLWVKEAPEAEKLRQPVDARAIGEKLMQVLDAQGFRRVKPGQRPEIVIGAKFCRGYLPNPYTYKLGREEQRAVLIDNLSDSQSQVGHPPLFEPMTGLLEKGDRANLEKLILMVVAWKYPPPRNTPKEPEPLWRATMTVDDPNHRDLNVVAGKMLEAGAPFFDRELAEPEVTVSQPLPAGHVKLGEAKVIEDAKPARK
jgi:hypothetical protein